jgi:1,4-dihydroxy-2-naphthoate octaprenyltransferase
VLAWYHTGTFRWDICLVGLLAAFFIANGIYLTNEYQDYESDRRNTGRIGGRGGMGLITTGGTQILVKGLLTRHQVLVAGIIFFLLAIPLGLVLQFVFRTGPWTIPLGALGMFLAYSYSNPPVKASYRGLGELFTMLGYGALIITAYYIQAGFSWLPIVVGLPFFVLPPGKILRNIPDAEADAAVGKNTLVVKFGKEMMVKVSIVSLILSIILFIPAVIVALTPFSAIRLLIVAINAIPVVFLVQSSIALITDRWRSRDGFEYACGKAFIARMLGPMTLSLTFLLIALLEHLH